MKFIKQNTGLLRSVRSWGVLGLVLALAVAGLELAVTAYPPADSLALFSTPSSIPVNGCLLAARPYLSGNNAFIYPNWQVRFFKTSGSGIFPALGVFVQTNSNGVTNSVLVPWNTTIRTELPGTTPLVQSSTATCGDRPQPHGNNHE